MRKRLLLVSLCVGMSTLGLTAYGQEKAKNDVNLESSFLGEDLGENSEDTKEVSENTKEVSENTKEVSQQDNTVVENAEDLTLEASSERTVYNYEIKGTVREGLQSKSIFLNRILREIGITENTYYYNIKELTNTNNAIKYTKYDKYFKFPSAIDRKTLNDKNFTDDISLIAINTLNNDEIEVKIHVVNEVEPEVEREIVIADKEIEKLGGNISRTKFKFEDLVEGTGLASEDVILLRGGAEKNTDIKIDFDKDEQENLIIEVDETYKENISIPVKLVLREETSTKAYILKFNLKIKSTFSKLEEPSIEDIRAKFSEHKFDTRRKDTFSVSPDLNNSIIGVLDEETMKNGLNTMNFIRYLLGFQPVSLDEDYNKQASAAAFLNAKIDRLTHYLGHIDGVTDEINELGSQGAMSSNMSSGRNSISETMLGWVSDNYNASGRGDVGHRTWVLNPYMEKTGFGRARKYAAMKSFDNGREGDEIYKNLRFYHWPATKTPIEYFENAAWHISLSKDLYRGAKLKKSNIRIKNITRNTDISVKYVKDNTPSSGMYGQAYSFDINETPHIGDIYEVEFDVFNTDDKLIDTLSYKVEFFSMDPNKNDATSDTGTSSGSGGGHSGRSGSSGGGHSGSSGGSGRGGSGGGRSGGSGGGRSGGSGGSIGNKAGVAQLSNSDIKTLLPTGYKGETKVLGKYRVPSDVVSGSWVEEKGNWKFINSSGEAYKSVWANIFNPYVSGDTLPYDWFRFDENGLMIVSWYTDTDGNVYYMNPNSDGRKGALMLGWQQINGKWYYFNTVSDGSRGKMLKNTYTPDGYYVNNEGVYVPNK